MYRAVLSRPLGAPHWTPFLTSNHHKSTSSQPVVLNFQDTKAAYASKSTFEIIRAQLVLKICGQSWIVDNNDKLMKFGKAILPGILFERLMKATFYGQFVGGTDVLDLRPKLMKMQEHGVKPILDYSVEADLGSDEACDEGEEKPVLDAVFQQDTISSDRRQHKIVARTYPYKGEESCEANLKIFTECLETAREVCDEDPFAAIKVTALSKPNALLEGSQFLYNIRVLFEAHSTPYADTVPDSVNLEFLPRDVLGSRSLLNMHRMTREQFASLTASTSLTENEREDIFLSMKPDDQSRVPFYKFRESCMPGPPVRPLYTALCDAGVIQPLSRSNLEALNRLEERLFRLSELAVKLDSKLLVDAEQTYFQPLIDFLANKMMARYNIEKVHVFNTYQCYLKATPSQLIYDMDKSRAVGYKLGAKLVRGAYMEQERTRAESLGYEDPIYPNKALTNSCYHNMIEVILKQVEDKNAEVMVASHNEFSVQYVVERMRQHDIHPRYGGIYFGQLLGMCDQVTFLLGAGGYSSYKYVPYGPVDAVLPYLSRRAYENKGMLQGSQKEIDLLKGELKRRRWGLKGE